jgi:hypothetical protein
VRSRGSRVAPYVVALAWYAVFIVRSSGTVGGQRAFPLFDDAMISMTYARNLAHGHGLVWNASGPRVEGITNVLWTFVMALPHALHVSDPFVGLTIELVGVALLVVIAELARSLVARLAPDRSAAISAAPWLVLLCYPLVYWTLRGTEVGLITTLLLGSLVLCLQIADRPSLGFRRPLLALCAVVGAGLLTRLDFLVFVPVIVALLVVTTKGRARARAVGAVVGAALGTICVQEFARRIYYGAWLPNTYTLKVVGVPLTSRADRGGRSVLFTLLVSCAAAVVFSAVAIWKRRDRRLMSVAAVGVVASAYNVYVGGDAWEWMRYANRYLTPAVVCLLCVAAIGVCDFIEMLEDGRLRRVVGTALAIAALLVAFQWMPAGDTLFKLPHWPEPSGMRFALLPILVLAWYAHRAWRHGISKRSLTTLGLVALAISVSFPAFAQWIGDNAIYAADDVDSARAGLEVRSITTPGATVAVVGAGNVIYFAHRNGVDILGRSDRQVARGPVHKETGFFPGHMKWNYGISIGIERPDVIEELWIVDCSDFRLLNGLGYVRMFARPPTSDGLELLARSDSTRILRDRVTLSPRGSLLRTDAPDCIDGKSS